MGVILEDLRETHLLGPATREWLVSGPRTPPFGAAHTRVAGFTEARDGYTFVRHDPYFSMLLVTESGEGRVLLDGKWQPCSANQAYVTAPRTPHAYHIKPGSHWRLHWVIYDESGNLPKLEKGRKPQLMTVDAIGLRHAVEGLCHENAGKADRNMLGHWAALVDHEVMRMLDVENADPRLDRLWLAIREDIGGSWDLRRMARLSGMGEENLRRLCHHHLKRSPMAHLTHVRMSIAADLLGHSEEKVASIAARIGYSDSFAFSTAFKRTTGKSPMAFRKANSLRTRAADALGELEKRNRTAKRRASGS